MEGESEGKTREQGSRVRDANRFVALECLAGGLEKQVSVKLYGKLGYSSSVHTIHTRLE